MNRCRDKELNLQRRAVERQGTRRKTVDTRRCQIAELWVTLKLLAVKAVENVAILGNGIRCSGMALDQRGQV